MILIGTMDWASTRMRGLFRCPNCGGTQNFRLRASRPFLTLYFIPVLPIGGLQEYVQCTQCKNSYETDILASTMMPSTWSASGGNGSSPPLAGEHRTGPASDAASAASTASAASLEEDLLKVIALIMVEDGHVTEDEIRIARRLYENMLDENLSREDLGRMCAYVQQQRLNTLSFLATARNRRSHEEKLLLVQAIFGVAGADGEVSPRRLSSLVKAQELLGLDEHEFQRAIGETSQWLI